MTDWLAPLAAITWTQSFLWCRVILQEEFSPWQGSCSSVSCIRPQLRLGISKSGFSFPPTTQWWTCPPQWLQAGPSWCSLQHTYVIRFLWWSALPCLNILLVECFTTVDSWTQTLACSNDAFKSLAVTQGCFCTSRMSLHCDLGLTLTRLSLLGRVATMPKCFHLPHDRLVELWSLKSLCNSFQLYIHQQYFILHLERSFWQEVAHINKLLLPTPFFLWRGFRCTKTWLQIAFVKSSTQGVTPIIIS